MGNLDLRVGSKYKLLRRLGEGGFGLVYQGVNVDTGEEVAIKLEDALDDSGILAAEFETYEALSRGQGIPRVYWQGQECQFNAMVFELLGPSLEDLFNYCGRRFSLKTVLMIADQLIVRLQYIHSNGVVHRDVKPENFLMGTGKHGNTVYVTDLGIAWSEYAATGRRSHGLIGTARFASINGHRGAEQSPRDDLESLGYVLIYFLRGSLPWQGLGVTEGKSNEQVVLEMKESLTTEQLCKDMPKELEKYMSYVRTLQAQDKPKYDYLRQMLRRSFIRRGFKHDNVFDWTILKYINIEDGEHCSEP